MIRNTALERLLAMHGLELARHLRRIVRDEETAQDLLQDTFLRALKAFDGKGPHTNARAWLYRIATNVALNHVRRTARERRALDAHAREAPTPATPGEGPMDPEAQAALWEHVASLPERQRVALTLRIADELDYAAIAERMGGTPEAARANVYQATRRLRQEVST